jgi:Protein of unknown function (DUF1579)
MRLLMSALIVIVVRLVAPVDAADAPQPKRDPQSSYEPRSQGGAGQRFLEKFAGEWELVKTFYPQSGDPVKVTGACHQTMIHEGRFLKSEFEFHDGDKTSTGLGIVGFEPDSGRFTSVWTDSRSTRTSIRQSDEPFDGTQIVLQSRTLSPNSAKIRRSRTVTRLEEDGRRIVHRQYTAGQDEKERLVMEMLMTQRPSVPVKTQ